MPYDPFSNPTGLIDRVRTDLVPGAAAGDVTLAGIKAEDRIIRVQALTFALTEGAPNTLGASTVFDRTAEFTIPAAGGKINNTGGTSTANQILLVTWYDRDWGETVDAAWIPDT